MDLSYLNARIKGWKGRILNKADYESFLKVREVEKYLELLRSTSYGPYIEVASVSEKRPEEVINLALRMDLSEIFHLLWRVAPEDSRPLLKAILSLWEVYDIKTVIRGIARGVKREEILNILIPAGELDRGALKELVHAKDVPDLIRILSIWGSPYGKVLKHGLVDYIKHHNILDMEQRVDFFMYGYLLEQLKSTSDDHCMIRELIQMRIDMQNIMTLFKVVGEGFPEGFLSGYFIQGGKEMKQRDFLRLAGINDREHLIRELSETLIDSGLKQSIAMADPEETDMLEEMFDDLIKRRFFRLSIEKPLSIAVALSFIYMKIREIKNLRIIARGKIFAVPEGELKRLLFYP